MSRFNNPNINPRNTKYYNFVFVIASFNNEQNVFKNLSSIVNQKYPRWRIIYINDCSTDNTEMVYQRVVDRFKIQSKCTYIYNNENMKQAYSKYIAYQQVEDDEIVCILDGDDWLSDDLVLLKLNQIYNTGCKVCTSKYQVYYEGKIKQNSINVYDSATVKHKDYRLHPNYAFGHLKSGYGYLFKSIPRDRLMFKGQWITCCTDVAEMYCITDLCNAHEIVVTNEIMYTYNKDNSVKYKNSHYNLSQHYDEQVYRGSLLRKLKLDEPLVYNVPKSFIIHLNTPDIFNQKLNMIKQMKYMDNKNYEFFQAIHYSSDVVQQTYEDYIMNYKENDFSDIFNLDEKNEIHTSQHIDLFIPNREHCNAKALGLIHSTLALFEMIEKEYPQLDHVTIFEDDVYSHNDIKNKMFISSELLYKKDFVYLGIHNPKVKIYKNVESNNIPNEIYTNIHQIKSLLYGTYSYIISKKMRKYVLDMGIDFFIQKNLSLDLFYNYIRITDNPKGFTFHNYYKQLFIPEVRKYGIQDKRDERFYLERSINIKDYYHI